MVAVTVVVVGAGVVAAGELGAAAAPDCDADDEGGGVGRPPAELELDDADALDPEDPPGATTAPPGVRIAPILILPVAEAGVAKLTALPTDAALAALRSAAC